MIRSMMHPTPRMPAMFLLAALSVLAPSAFAATTAPEVVHVGIAQTMSDSAYYIGEEKGYFRDEGITLDMTPFKSAAGMVAPLGTGELDVGGGTVSAGLYNAAARGLDVKIVADEGSMRPGYGYSSLLVRKDLVDSGRYKTFADLKGMKVAVAAPGSGSASALNEALKKGGLTFSDADVVYMGFPEQFAAYRNKGIDASISTEPTTTLIREAGLATRIAGDDVFDPGQQNAVVFFSANFINKRHDVAERFMRAYIRGVRYYMSALKDGHLAGPNASDVIAILTRYTKIKDPAMYSRIVPSSADPDGRVNLKALKNDLAFFRQQGLVKDDKIGVEDVYDGSFVEAALKALGPYQAQP